MTHSAKSPHVRELRGGRRPQPREPTTEPGSVASCVHLLTATLSLQPNAETACTLAEGLFTPFQDVTDAAPDACVFKTASYVSERWNAAPIRWTRRRHDDLVGVGVDDQIGVVSDHDDLAL